MSDTIREHYIPQFYLKNYSADNKRIYQYQINSNSPSKLVPIESVCCEKNLYEFRDENGKIIEKNIIEKAFAAIEGEISNVIKTVLSKSHHIENLRTLCFLTPKEKAMLSFFVSTQVLRAPSIIDAVKNAALDFGYGKTTENFAYNIALQSLFPIYKELNAKDKNVLNSIMKWFENMSFQIGIINRDCLLTCDRPIILHGKDEVFKPEDVIFTLTPRVLLHMTKIKLTGANYKNRLIFLNEEFVCIVNRDIIANCNRWIFSKNKITSKQIRLIEKIRREN